MARAVGALLPGRRAGGPEDARETYRARAADLNVGRVRITCPRCDGRFWTDIVGRFETTSIGDLNIRLSVGPANHSCAGDLADTVRELPPNAVLILRGKPFVVTEEVIAAVAAVGRKDILVVHLGDDPGASLDVLDEQQMNENGWIRRP